MCVFNVIAMKKSWCLLLLIGILCGCENKHHEETEEGFLSVYEEQFYNLHRKEFVEWVKSHPETLDMDLTEQAEQAEVQINESPDGAIRVYNWISGGGTSPDWTNFTQYRDSKGNVRILDGLPMDDTAAGGTMTDIIDGGIINGEKVYFFSYYSKASSQEGYNYLYPAVMEADTFALGPRFLHDGEMSDFVGISYTISDWYFRTNGEGWDQMYHYDLEKQRLYVINTDIRMSLTGNYDIYDYDKKRNVFRYAGTGGSPFLHESISKLAFLKNVFETEQHLVRIDRLHDYSYRLTLWNNPSFAKQTDRPAMVLTDGLYQDSINSYVFKVDDKLTYMYEENGHVSLKLYYQGKLMYDEKERDYRVNTVGWTEGYYGDENEFLPDSEGTKMMMATEHYIIRIDSTKTGDYRYASWKHFPFWEGLGKPDIVLTHGRKRMIDYEEYFEFRNGDYVYQVPTDDTNRMKVTKDGIKICDDMVWGIFTADNIVQDEKD